MTFRTERGRRWTRSRRLLNTCLQRDVRRAGIYFQLEYSRMSDNENKASEVMRMLFEYHNEEVVPALQALLDLDMYYVESILELDRTLLRRIADSGNDELYVQMMEVTPWRHQIEMLKLLVEFRTKVSEVVGVKLHGYDA